MPKQTEPKIKISREEIERIKAIKKAMTDKKQIVRKWTH